MIRAAARVIRGLRLDLAVIFQRESGCECLPAHMADEEQRRG